MSEETGPICSPFSVGRMGFCMGFSKIRSFVKTPKRS